MQDGEWVPLKPRTPYGELPILTVDGRPMAQSKAILRYVGKLTALYPTDPEEALFVDEVVETCEELFSSIFAYRGTDKGIRRQTRETVVRENIPRYWEALDKRVGSKGGPFVMGGRDKLSIADVVIVVLFNAIKCGLVDHIPSDTLDGCAALREVYDNFMRLPEVVDWYTKHPISIVTTSN